MKELVKRKKLRLQNYDYSLPGYYFVTVCTKNREHLFGDVINGEMQLNEFGKIVEEVWNQLPKRLNHIQCDQFVIMPNHVHGIITIVGAQLIAPVKSTGVMNHAPTIGNIIRVFKSIITYQIHQSGFSKFKWQRNYYEHVIRNENELYETRQYILNNPAKWDLDPENNIIVNVL